MASVARAPAMARSPATNRGGVKYSEQVIKDERGKTIDEARRRQGERLKDSDGTPVILTTTMPTIVPTDIGAGQRGFLIDALRQQSLADGRAHLDADEWMEWARTFYDGVTDADIREVKRDIELQDQQAWEACAWGANRAATKATSITGGNEKRRFRRMTEGR